MGRLEADQCAEHNGSLANMLGGTSKEGIGRASPIDKSPAGWAVHGQGAGNGASGSKPAAKCRKHATAGKVSVSVQTYVHNVHHNFKANNS